MVVGKQVHLDCVGVVRSKGVQVAQLTKATLDVGHVDFYVVLEGTEVGGVKGTLDVV